MSQENDDLAQACQRTLKTRNEHELEIAINKYTIDPLKFKIYKKIILDKYKSFDNECLGLSIDTSSLMKEIKQRD